MQKPPDSSTAGQPPPWDTPAPFYALWQTSPDALALTDLAGLVLAANPAYRALHGAAVVDLVSQGWAVILPKATRAAMEGPTRSHTAPAITQWRNATRHAVESRLDLGRLPDGRPVLLSSLHVLAETGPSGPPSLAARRSSSPTTAARLIDAIQHWGIEVVLPPPLGCAIPTT